MIEKYLDYYLQERFQEIRLELGGKYWESDDWYISHLLDYYENFKDIELKYKKLLLKYKILNSKFKILDNYNKLLLLK